MLYCDDYVQYVLEVYIFYIVWCGIIYTSLIQYMYHVYSQYTSIVGKYIMYLYELYKELEKRAFGELFSPVSQQVEIN